MKCIHCEFEAKWVRHTQFAGDHPFCEDHAFLEKDFGDNTDNYWAKVECTT